MWTSLSSFISTKANFCSVCHASAAKIHCPRISVCDFYAYTSFLLPWASFICVHLSHFAVFTLSSRIVANWPVLSVWIKVSVSFPQTIFKIINVIWNGNCMQLLCLQWARVIVWRLISLVSCVFALLMVVIRLGNCVTGILCHTNKLQT